MSEQDAARHALVQVADWNALRRAIYLARNKKDNMEPRVTRFWLPGLLGFALAMIPEVASYRFDSHPLVLSLDRGTPVLRFHFSWIFALLLVGAITAYLSRRAGGWRYSAHNALIEHFPCPAIGSAVPDCYSDGADYRPPDCIQGCGGADSLYGFGMGFVAGLCAPCGRLLGPIPSRRVC